MLKKKALKKLVHLKPQSLNRKFSLPYVAKEIVCIGVGWTRTSFKVYIAVYRWKNKTVHQRNNLLFVRIIWIEVENFVIFVVGRIFGRGSAHG